MISTHLIIFAVKIRTWNSFWKCNKNTYQGLLKTSDAAALTSSLKVIEDGTGVDSALSLSTTTVKAESLQINTVADGSSSTVLVWDSSSKTVSKEPSQYLIP